MENSQYRRHHQPAPRGADSPRLHRSKSGSVAITSPRPEPHTIRSKKTSRIEETSTKKTQRKLKPSNSSNGDGGFVRFLPPSKSKIDQVPRRTRSASTSPSAWALSPSRPCSAPLPVQLDLAPVPKSPASYGKLMKHEAKNGGVSAVLKYFKQKKVSPVLEEEYHRYRVVYNRLLQWRFANARRESAMAAVNRVAQKKLFNGWAKISLFRNLIVEKHIQIQKLEHQIKLYHIIGSQMNLLNEWSRIEPKNTEAVGRVVRKLSAVSTCLPLVHNAEADIMSVYDAFSTAIAVMDDIEAMILDMYLQVERTCFLLTELSVMLKQQQQFFQQLETGITVVASLEVQEKSLRLHCIQMAKEVNEKV